MHVGLNLIFCVPGETGGMEVAARSLIPELARQPGLRLTAFVNREAAGTIEGADELVVPVRASNRIEWVRGEQHHLPRLAMQARCDVVHSLGSTAPLWGRFRRVTTIHDLIYLVAPEAHFGLRALGMRALVPAAARRSHRIIAVSRSTRDDLVEHLHVDAAKIDVVPNGVAPPSNTPTPEAELRGALDLGRRTVVLCVGGKRPHKNTVRVIDALAEMHDAPVFVVPGYPSPYDEELRARADALRVDLRLPAYLEQDQLDGLYALSACVVVPSLYEGFGLPVLEAMARGVPVACSNRSALPEVAGCAALLFDPEDPAAIRAAIERILAGEGEGLRAKGRERAREFSWRHTAELTAAAYRRA
jgi:glycosyltransferase involved in cell wall biosynthesis